MQFQKTFFQKKLPKIIIFSALFFALNIQNTLAQPPAGRGENGGTRPPAIGIIAGKVLDAATKQPIEFATISVIRVRDSSIATGGLSDSKGDFLINEVPFGKFKVKIDFIGYKTVIYKDLVSVKPPENVRTDLGEILLVTTATNLEEATVVGNKAQFVNSLDKKVYTVGRDIISTGSSVSDLLANVPSVTVDIDGGVSLRGSANVTVLIDGKPSALMGASKADILRQLPASSIESIELITNPSAKYDPEGVSGIINIVLKKNKQKGFNGQVQVGVGNNSTFTGVNKYSGSVAFNYRTPKYNLFLNYGYRNDVREGYGYFDRQVFVPNVKNGNNLVPLGFQNFSSNSNTNNSNISLGNNARIGADFYLNKNNTFGIAAGLNTGRRVQNEFTKFREDTVYLDNNKQTSRYNERTILNDTKNFSYDGNLNFKHQFTTPKQEITADVSYSNNNSIGIGNYTPDTTIFRFANVNHLKGKELQTTTSNNYVFTAQTDYTQPMKDGAKLELGYRYTNRAVDNDLLFQNSKGNSDVLFTNTGRTNHFLYGEQIHAAYSTYANTLPFLSDKLGYQVGVRLEQTDVLAQLLTTNQTFKQSYFSVFPSGNLSYKLSKTDDLRLSFSRRIRRPGGEEINPFPEYDNPTILRTGNPAVKPEFTNAYELGYLKNWEKHSVALTGYFRRTEDQIQRFIVITPADSAKGTPILTNVTFVNYAFRNNYGVEAVVKNEFFKWWNTMTTLNAFQTEINTGTETGNATNSGLGFSARLQSNMTLPKGFSLQITGNYNAPMIMAQGYFIGMSSADIGIKKDFLKGLFNVSLSMSDVFNNQRFEVHTKGSRFDDATQTRYNTFQQDALRKRETQIVTLTASFRFGNIKPDNARKRTRETEGGGSMPDGGGI